MGRSALAVLLGGLFATAVLTGAIWLCTRAYQQNQSCLHAKCRVGAPHWNDDYCFCAEEPEKP